MLTSFLASVPMVNSIITQSRTLTNLSSIQNLGKVPKINGFPLTNTDFIIKQYF